jgi:hypothetical protein
MVILMGCSIVTCNVMFYTDTGLLLFRTGSGAEIAAPARKKGNGKAKVSVTGGGLTATRAGSAVNKTTQRGCEFAYLSDSSNGLAGRLLLKMLCYVAERVEARRERGSCNGS